MKRTICVICTALTVVVCGCPKGQDTNTSADGKPVYVILDTWTDGFDRAKAKQKAQDAMTRYPNLGCMVGLFAYNPPICLDAVRDADKLGKIKIVAFDENNDTLQGIKDGHIFGSIVQNPYQYGYESVRVLAALARGDKSVLPKDGNLPVPERIITKENVDEFWTTLKKQTAGTGKQPKQDAAKITVAYVTNGIDPFWVIAEQGARDAAADAKIDCNVEVRMPPKGVEDQKRMVQELLAGNIKGIAISPIDADNQGDLMEEIAGRTNLITHDSDAPKSRRLCYIGIDNYKAGRSAGKLVKQAMPNGGSIMIFVGRLGQDNAKLRRQGLIDELLDRSFDPTRYDEPGQELRSGKK